MIKSVGILQRRAGLDPAGFRQHYERNHAPLATRLLGFPGYQRNYPENDRARAELGLDVFSEFWFRDAAEIARIGALMRGDVGAELLDDERRFLDQAAGQTYEVSERLHGTRPAPGNAVRAIAVVRLPAGTQPGSRERELDLDRSRVRERAISGVIAALYSVPVRATAPLPEGVPVVGCVESFWLASREALAECNRWRAGEGATPLSVVEECGTPVLASPD